MAVQLDILGLQTYSATLSAEPGSLEKADNIDLDQPGAATPRRGFNFYGSALANPAKQLLSYKDKILRHSGEVLYFDSDNAGAWVPFTTPVKEVQPGLRIKGQELRSNLYITSATGIKKISLSDIDAINNASLESSGTPRALDIVLDVDSTFSGILPLESKASYAVVWGIRDGNDAVNLGYPSAIATAEFRGLPQLITDFNKLLDALAANCSDPEFLSFKIDPGTAAIDFYNQILAVNNYLSVSFDGNLDNASPYYIWQNDSLSNKDDINSFEIINNVCYIRFNSTLTDIMLPGVSPGASVATYNMVPDLSFAEGLFPITATGKLPLTYSARLLGGGNSFSRLTSYTVTSNVVTLNFSRDGGTGSSIANRLADPATTVQKVTIKDCSVPALNGTFTAVSRTADTITFNLTIANTASPELITGEVEVADQSADTSYTISFAVTSTDNIIGGAASFATDTTVATDNSYLGLPRPTTPAEDGSYNYTNVSELADYLDLIVVKLLNEDPATTPLITTANIDLVKRSARVSFQVQIPPTITSTRFFYQVYRSQVQTADALLNIDSIVASQDLRLAYEGTISQTEISNGITNAVIDVASNSFVQQNQQLYTNQNVEGIGQANSIPPVAHDITEFRGCLFFANTKTQFTLNTTLLSTDSIDETRPLQLIYTDSLGVEQVISMTFLEPWAKSTVDFLAMAIEPVGAPSSMLLYVGPGDLYEFYFVTPTNTPPAVIDQRNIIIDCEGLTTTQQLTAKFAETVATQAGSEFSVIYDGVSTVVEVINKNTALLSFPNNMLANTNFITAPTVVPLRTSTAYDPITSPQAGIILLYKDANYSIGQKIDLTARSIVNTINKYTSNTVFVAYYNSTQNTQPGFIQIEERAVDTTNQFYMFLSGTVVDAGQVFNPRSEGLSTVTNVATVGQLVTVTYSGYDLTNEFESKEFIFLSIPGFNKPVQIISITSTTFTFNNATPLTSSSGYVGYYNTGVNQTQENGLSWSKFQQPDAVPALNFLLIGPQDKKIVRIIGLRNTLLVFKEEGLYLVSQTGPNQFDFSLLDGSAVIEAPDSIAQVNNKVYVLCTKGFCAATDNQVKVVSMDIKNLIDSALDLDLSAAFAIPVEVDNSVLLFVPEKRSDTYATAAYRLNVPLNRWSKYKYPARCGISANKIIYLGNGTDNYVDKQRRNLNRTDYADREYYDVLTTYDYFPSSLEIFSNSSAIYQAGDVVLQEQFITILKFNNFIGKMNVDSGVVFQKGQTIPNSYLAQISDNLSIRINNIITYLETFNGANAFGATTITPLIGDETFAEQGDKFNEIIAALNTVTSASTQRNYLPVGNPIRFETPIVSVNLASNKFKIASLQPFLQGEIIVYKAIKSDVTFNPTHFGAPDMLKHIREGTAIFQDLGITSGIIKYSTDLNGVYDKLPFKGNGNGAWGLYNWGEFFWGGASPETPVRTLIPLNKQRCRFMRVGIEHGVARESYSFYGFSLEVNQGASSSRGYPRK